ncbi:hypothetical protein CEXT_273271 [Caerostris extrusa]|uniref:Uncharacterized protein n=1 Tax=Caerostris extrusa TaxID=172846 RepID=A0AAV4MCZ9_CAEEX|nr:hypothetical protein CEXT_273271 [Caerostris extrusa]
MTPRYLEGTENAIVLHPAYGTLCKKKKPSVANLKETTEGLAPGISAWKFLVIIVHGEVGWGGNGIDIIHGKFYCFQF